MSKTNAITKNMEEDPFQDKRKKRAFSIDLNCRNSLNHASFDNDPRVREARNDEITIEGTIGFFKKAQFVEGEILEIEGSEGVLRVDLTSQDIGLPHSGDHNDVRHSKGK